MKHWASPDRLGETGEETEMRKPTQDEVNMAIMQKMASEDIIASVGVIKTIDHESTYETPKKKSAYDKEVSGKVVKVSKCGKYARIEIDFYDLANELDLPDEVKHSIKKLWALGSRSGGKSKVRDLKDCNWQNNRAIERIEVEEALNEILP